MSDDPILRQRRVALTQADTGLLLRRMLAEIPGLKVVDWSSLSWPPEAERPHLCYWDGEGDPPDVNVVLWVEQSDWREAWEYNEWKGVVEIKETPNAVCWFHVCRLEAVRASSLKIPLEHLLGEGRKPTEEEVRKALESAADGTQETLVEGRLTGYQYDDDVEQKSFLDGIFAIVDQECSDRLVWDTFALDAKPQVLKRFVWAGPDAIRWALERQSRYIAHALRPLASLKPEQREEAVESYGLHICEQKTFHGFIRLIIPATWVQFHMPKGRGVARDDENDNGTLWVDTEAFEGTKEAVREYSLHVVEDAFRKWKEDGENRDVTRLEVGGFLGVYGVSETVGEGTPLRVFSWTLTKPVERWAVLISIRLVLTHDNLADPLCAGVVETIQNAVANIRIDEEAFLEQVATLH